MSDNGFSAANGHALAAFIVDMRTRELPPDVLDAARMCLTDWLGVALGAIDEDAGRVVRGVAAGWKSQGKSTVIFGEGGAAAPFAALANGTLAHCLDFDDTYVKAITHTSAPVWAATLALGEETDATESAMLAAFVTGFETACRAGYGLGEAVTTRGWHSTGVFGRIGAAAASAALLKLDHEQTLHALGVAATQTAGLTASFGTMAKPFHAGKAAMDGVLSAQLAAAGFCAATDLLEPGGGLDGALVQDKSVRIEPADFSAWEILNNSFKPYAACHLTHPAIDAARSLAGKVANEAVISIRADVGALALQVTGGKSGAPMTPLEGKFDIKYCIGLALRGHALSAADFREPWQRDDAALAFANKVDVYAASDMGFASARITVECTRGSTLCTEVPVAKGHPGNPMTWEDMWSKFSGLTEKRMGPRTRGLFEAMRNFGNGAGLQEIHKHVKLAVH
jgi:2-methylcitrate dehydratase PrpD